VSEIVGMSALQRRLQAIGETNADMRALQLSTIHEAQALVHRKTGHLQRSIVPGPVTATTAVIEARTPYAASLEFGAKPHIIKAKPGHVLAWGGERRLSGTLRSGSKPEFFATFVHHPGNKPYPYLVPGAKRALQKGGIIATITQRWNNAA
jgi:hypothetical protein